MKPIYYPPIYLILLLLTMLLTSCTIQVDGTARGRTLISSGGVELQVGRRRVGLCFYEFRPGRVYYRLVVRGG